MKKLLFLIIGLFFLTISAWAQCTITLPGNSLSGSFGPWGGTGYFYTQTFNVNAPGGIDITYYDIDVSQFTEGITWALKGVAIPGVSKSNTMTSIDPKNNSVWCNILNMEVASGVDWDGHPLSTLGSDGIVRTSDDTRHQGTQDWYRKMTGGKIDGPAAGPYYNNESYVTPNLRHPSAPVKTASELNSYDFRIRILPTGPNAYTYEMWFRMHNSAATIEGAYWIFNKAMNNTVPDASWRAFTANSNGTGTTVFTITDIDLSSVYVFMGLGNFMDPAAHSLTWGNIVVTGTQTLSANAGNDVTFFLGYEPSVTLTVSVSGGSGDYSYSWSPGGAQTQSITVSPATTTAYNVTVTDESGCFTSSSDEVIVNVNNVICDFDKVIVCHNGHDICISADAVPTHLAHGDYLGNCGGNFPKQVISEGIPEVFQLYDNYPNPFNPVTKIKYDIPRKAFVKIIIYDITGGEVDVLINQQREAGRYNIDWDGSSYASGVYFYKLVADSRDEAGDYINVKKMILIK